MPTTVDKIRRALEKRDGIAEEEMVPLAEAYREQVQEVNRRLDDSVMLLRKGLRSEAIQRIEMTPNALDAAAELEFPEWDEWNEILQFMGVPLPPRLNQDYVAQVNEAIIESLPLDALLRRHRRLAIAKAPLSVRLRTLRQIARVDSANNVWHDDVESWEKIRLQQIDGELANALEGEDARWLYQLHQELTGGPWRITPSSRLIEQSAFAAEAHVRENQEAELTRLAPLLQEAFGIRDEASARSLRSQWQSIRSKYKVDLSPALESSVAQPMQWLEDLDRQAVMESERQMAMATLESSLDSSQPIEEVQRAYDQASRFGEAMPEEITKRVEQLSEKPRKQKLQKLYLAVGGLVVLLIGATVAGVMAIMSGNQQAERQEMVAAMQSFIDAEQFEEAITYYTSISASNPAAASDPKMIACNATAKKAVEKESFRVQRFQELLSQIDNKDPAMIDEVALPQLEELAVTDAEKALVADLVKRKSQYMAEQADRQTEDMLEKIAEYRTSFGQLQARGSGQDNRRAIESLRNDVARLPSQHGRASKDALSKQEILLSQITSVLRQMKDDGMITEQRNSAIEVLMGSRSLEVFMDQLRDFSTQSVSRTNFVDFGTVLVEEDHWINVEKANQWLDELAKTTEDGISSAEAVALLNSASRIRKLVSPNPAFADMRKFDEDMEEIRDRKRVIDDLLQRLKQHPLARMVTLNVDDGNGGVTSHYLDATYAEQSEERFNKQGSIGIQVVSTALGESRLRSFAGPLDDIEKEPMNSILSVADQIKANRARFDQNWEQEFIRQVVDVVRKPKLDGVAKEWLIATLVDSACEGSRRLESALPRTRQALQRRTSVRGNWYVERPKTSELNKAFDTVLRGEMNIAFKRVADPLADYESTSKKRIEWIGFLAKSMRGQMEYHLRGALPEYDGKLYVAGPSRDGDSETSVLPVGELKQGHITLTPNPVYQVPGRPLFLFPN